MGDILRHLQANPIFTVRAVCEVILLAAVLYMVLAFLRGSRGAGVLRGMLVLVFLSIGVVFIAAKYFQMEHIVWVFEKIAALSIISAVIIFQPELRRGLLRLGLNPLVGRFVRADSPAIDEIVEACVNLSKRSLGALIAIQRRVPLNDFAERGTVLNAEITRELLETIFFKGKLGEGTILHDAGTIIIGNRVAGAGCLFPLSENPELSKSLGTRHRAALGLSEESDAVTVVVSEETGRMSIAVEGKFIHNLSAEELRAKLTELCLESVEGTAPVPEPA
jgi:diadenylate cyclase